MKAPNRMNEAPQLAPAPMQSRPSEPPRDEDEIDLAELFGTLWEGRWLIALTALAVLFVGAVYAFTAIPIYKADSLVQVEEKSGGLAGLKELSDIMGEGDTASEAEIELIKSRAVLDQVIEKLHLDIVVEPTRFPVIGGAFSRRHAGDEVASAKLGFNSYAWGGEKIDISRLELPKDLQNQPLTLRADENGAYTLFDPDGRELLKGKAGEAAKKDESTEIFVGELKARPGTNFIVKKQPRVLAILDLQDILSVKEKGKKTGIISLELQGPDKKIIQTALDEVMVAYVRQNVERKAEEAEKTLEFVNAQLPQQKAALDAAELALNEYRKKTGKLDISVEAQSVVQRSADVEKSLTELEMQRSELRQRYTDSHPAIVALDKKIGQLQREKKAVETAAKALPENELNSVRLVRDVTVANELYVLLLNKAQELKMVKSGTIGNVRVVDSAIVYPKPVSPKKAIALALSLLIGLSLGVALTFVRKSLNRGVDDPDQLEQALGLPVYASLPFSQKQSDMMKNAQRGKQKLQPLAKLDAADLAMESLRSLRTSLQFSLASAKNNVIMVGGSRPGVGKSFVSVNLAHVLADTGKRVLLVDADLRKGQLHRYFEQAREGGLSELISGAKDVDACIRKTGMENLSFLSSGTIPPNPSELLASEKFEQVMKELQGRFDLVLMDAPPVLAVTDGALLARAAGVNLLVVKSGLHPLREIAAAVSRLQQSGTRPNGFVFNAVPLRDRLYGYGKYRYHYQYDYR